MSFPTPPAAGPPAHFRERPSHLDRLVPLFRRALAAVLVLSVLLSTLGMTHARCSQMEHGAADAGALVDMAGMDHGDGTAVPHEDGEHCQPAPGERSEGGADASCLLVAHCATAMIAAERVAESGTPATSAARAASHESAPTARALEPDSPPPRG